MGSCLPMLIVTSPSIILLRIALNNKYLLNLYHTPGQWTSLGFLMVQTFLCVQIIPSGSIREGPKPDTTPGTKELCGDCSTIRKGCKVACIRFYPVFIEKRIPKLKVRRESEIPLNKGRQKMVARLPSRIPIVESPQHFLEKGIPKVLVLDGEKGAKKTTDHPLKLVDYLPQSKINSIKSVKKFSIKPKVKNKIVLSPRRNKSQPKRYRNTKRSKIRQMTKEPFHLGIDPGLLDETLFATTSPSPTPPTTEYGIDPGLLDETFFATTPTPTKPTTKYSIDPGLLDEKFFATTPNPTPPTTEYVWKREYIPDEVDLFPPFKSGPGLKPDFGVTTKDPNENTDPYKPDGGRKYPKEEVTEKTDKGSYPREKVPGGSGFHPHGTVPGDSRPQGPRNSFPLFGVRGQNGEYYIYQTSDTSPGFYELLGVIHGNKPEGSGFVPGQGGHVPPVSKGPRDGDHDYSAYDYETTNYDDGDYKTYNDYETEYHGYYDDYE